MPRGGAGRNFSDAMSPVAVFILAICLVGVVVAGVAFAWAALGGEFTDAAQAAYLVFDDDDDAHRPPGPRHDRTTAVVRGHAAA